MAFLFPRAMMLPIVMFLTRRSDDVLYFQLENVGMQCLQCPEKYEYK